MTDRYTEVAEKICCKLFDKAIYYAWQRDAVATLLKAEFDETVLDKQHSEGTLGDERERSGL